MSGGVATVGRLAVSVTGDLDDLKASMAEAKSVVGAAAKDMAVNVGAVSDSTDQVTAAGKRMIASLQEEIRTFGMSRDEIRIYQASLTGAGDEVARLIGQLQALKAQQAAAPQVAADAQATQRIKDMVSASLAQSAAMHDVAASTQNLTTAQAGAARVTASWSESQRLQAQNMAGVAASMRAASAGTQELSAQTQAIMNRYDPLGTKLRSLQSELAILRKELGNSVDPAVMRTFEGLEAEIDATREKMAKAGVEGFGEMEGGAQKSAFATAGATRELIVLGHEVVSGNFSRIPGSLMVLAERVGGFSAMVEALAGGLALTALGAAAIAAPFVLAGAAAYQGAQDFKAMNLAIGLTSNYAGQSVDSINQLATRIGTAGQMTTGTAKEMVTAFVASGKIGGQALEKIAVLAGNYAQATGQSVEEVTPKLIQLFANPKQGAEELKDSMHILTAENVSYIEALENSGQRQEAQLVLAQALAGHLTLQQQQVSGLTVAWNDFKSAMSGVWDLIKQHASDSLTPIQAAQAQLDDLQSTPNLFGGDKELDAKIAKQKEFIASLVEADRQKREADQADSANKDRLNAVTNELNQGQLHQVDLLKEKRRLLEGMPDTKDVKQRRLELDNQIENIERAMGADAREMAQQKLTDGEQYNLLVTQGQASALQNQLKMGQITQEQFDLEMTQNKLQANAYQQNYELEQSRVAGITSLERQAHLDKLKYLQEEARQIRSNGDAAVAYDNQQVMTSYMDALSKSGQEEIKSLEAQIAKEREHGLEIGKTKEQIDALRAAQQQQRAEALQGQVEATESMLTALNPNDHALDNARTIYDTWLAETKLKIEDLNTAAAVSSDNAIREANAKTAADALAAWKHSANTIENDLTNAILDGGGKGWKKLIRDMEMAFAKLVLQPILEPISGGLASIAAPFMSGSAIGTSATTAFSGGATGLAGLASTASSLYGAVTGGMTLSGGLGSGFMGSLAGGLNGAGVGSGLTSSIGLSIGNSIADVVGPSVAGAISTGLGAVATALPWIGAAVAAVSIGKLAFGMGPKETTTQGMSGILSATSLTGSDYSNWTEKGGWFRSDKHGTDTTAFSAQTVAQFTQGLQSLESAASGFASSLGVSADWIKTYSKTFDITLTGDATKDQQAITAFFSGVGDEIANRLVPNLADFSKQGETASATLQRLAGDFQATDQAMQMIGKTAAEAFGSSGLDSAKAREQLVNAFGSASSLTSLTQSFANNYLTNSEKLVPVQKALDAAMASLGLSSVKTEDQFKAVVNSLDLTTQAGANEFASLMALNEAFVQVYAGGQTAEQALQAQQAAQEKIAQERQGLQDQLDQLTMTSTQLAQKQRDALDDSNKALFDQVQALKDQASAAQAAQAAIDAEKKVASSLLGDVDSAFTVLQNVTKATTDSLNARITAEKALSDAVKSTLSSMMSTAGGMDRAAAQAQIKAAVAVAKAGGPLPAADSLKDALSVLSKDASSQFATKQDYLRDLYSTQADLSQLGDLADSSLSVDQQQLDSLNAMLAADQQQIDLLKGIATSLTPAQAQAAFQASVSVAQANPTIAANSGISGLYQSILGRMPDASGLAYWQNAAANGMSLDQISAYIKSSNEYKHLQGIPGFAVGTNFVPNDMLAQIHQGERIIPAADNRALMAQLTSPSSNSGALLAEVKALREDGKALRVEIEGLRAEARATAGHTEKSFRLWKRVIPNDKVITGTEDSV